MGDLTDMEFEAAVERGRLARQTEPRAVAVHYDRLAQRVVIELANGATFTFPVALAQGLEHATEEQRAAVEVLGAGYGLHWEELDVDLSVAGVLAGVFGTRAHMAGLTSQASDAAPASRPRVTAQD